ncbi:hypothetical protein A5844_002522 [Enterococcus sp. 10A9_DIV0425]|uniref:DUF5626 domain-containing protein n=1 Tax=Candidatus Enterococcus wittei TaxID=1987383 RepID=A0A242JVX7_9ENTE|nr:DUF5626 family protein [Enterococcus sp. 10A9_DIV0425]OTP06848.1 hypothetical protein A5844_002522 [Enterococcus sp. 10A9_DIV0425]THE14330.1 hypothetical protein E1H99_04850 [Enterococcus hirae]
MLQEKYRGKAVFFASFTALVMLFILFVPTAGSVQAHQLETENPVALTKEQGNSSNHIEFDLSKNRRQVETIRLSNEEVVKIVVEPVSNSQIRLGNGGWNIYYYSGIFNCGFKIKVSSNSITSAYDPWYYHIGVSVKSSSLKRDNLKQATYYFEFGTPVWDFGGWSGWLRATINHSNNLVVTVK